MVGDALEIELTLDIMDDIVVMTWIRGCITRNLREKSCDMRIEVHSRRPHLLSPTTNHLTFLDCARGYAILLVIMAHTVEIFPEMPWPVRRMALLGWFGVQMFFLASMITLLRSWHAERARNGSSDLRSFAIRRIFRIAPMYYFGITLYLITDPPKIVNIVNLLAAAAFLDSWNINWLTAPHAWRVVPGGWSISVEMSFYVFFPLYAQLVNSLKIAIGVFVTTLVVGTYINSQAYSCLIAAYPTRAVIGFLYYWLPNQASIFAFGGVLYYILPSVSRLRWVKRQSAPLAAACVGMFLLTTFIPHGEFLGDSFRVPQAHLAVLILGSFLMVLSAGAPFLNGSVVRRIGQLSFSAYILHFAVLHVLQFFPKTFREQSAGLTAVFALALAFGATVVATYCLSMVTHRGIEQPMINLGRSLVGRLPSR